MVPQKDIFQHVVDHFTSEQEETRAAAAFAAGNIAIGNLHQFLPVIVNMVETDPKKRLLALHAAKEVTLFFEPRFISRHVDKRLLGRYTLLPCPIGRCCRSSVGPTLREFPECRRDDQKCCCSMSWKVGHYPSIKISAPIARKQSSFLSLRSVSILLFQDRVKDPNPDTRATVVSAIRYTFADTSQSYDELLSPLLVDFLSLMVDENLVRTPSFWGITPVAYLLSGCSQACAVFVEFCCTNKASSRSGPSCSFTSESLQGDCYRSCLDTNRADGTLDAQGGRRSRNTEDCVRDDVHPGTSPHLFKCLLILMIRPIHSSIHASLSSTSMSSLDVSFLAFLTTQMKLKSSRT